MKTKTPLSFGIQWGLVCGITCVIVRSLMFALSVDYFVGLMAFSPLLIYYTLFFVGGFQYRKQLGGFISFKDVFVMLIVTSAISVLINTIFGYVMYAVVDPNLGEETKKYWMDFSFRMMNGKVSEDQMQKKLQEMQDQDYGWQWSKMLWGVPLGVALDACIVLIIAAVVKKKNPMLEFESHEQPTPPAMQ